MGIDPNEGDDSEEVMKLKEELYDWAKNYPISEDLKGIEVEENNVRRKDDGYDGYDE